MLNFSLSRMRNVKVSIISLMLSECSRPVCFQATSPKDGEEDPGVSQDGARDKGAENTSAVLVFKRQRSLTNAR